MEQKKDRFRGIEKKKSEWRKIHRKREIKKKCYD